MQTVANFVAAVNAAIINPILALLFAAALLYFIWGGFVFIISAGNDQARSEGRQHMLWGVIGMVIMVSVFALLNIGLNTFNVDRGTLPQQLPAF
jgi:TRAP-type C4-dicarboxylate transport system permease small subunit